MTEHKRLPHLLPFARQPLVFLTAVTFERRPLLADRAAFDVLTGLWKKSAELDGWFVGDYLLMPDHLHLFACAALESKPLARWVATWKSLSTRALKKPLSLTTGLWQRDYFDRFVRSAENYSEKWDYVAANPVRAGLCAKAEDWPWRGRIFDLRF